MHYKNDNILTEQTLGTRIATTLFCIKCRLETECSDIARRTMLDALASELKTLINPYLEKLTDRWNDELPYGKERPLRGEWGKMSAQADELIRNIDEGISDIPNGDEYEMDRTQQKNLAEQLRLLSGNVLRVYELLHPRNLPEKYAGYFRNMLKVYDLDFWKVKQCELENMISLRPAKLIKKFCEDELQKQLDKLAAYEDYNIIDCNRTTIYQEAAGIKLWQDDTDDQEEAMELLYTIRSVIYLAEQCRKPIRQEVCEPTEEEPRENIHEHEHAPKTVPIYITSEYLEMMKSHFSQFERFLRNGYSAEWVNTFCDSMARGSISCTLNKGKRYKHLSNILGELCRKGVYSDETTVMAKDTWLHFGGKSNSELPQPDSFARYIRKGLDGNESLRLWVVEYMERNGRLRRSSS